MKSYYELFSLTPDEVTADPARLRAQFLVCVAAHLNSSDASSTDGAKRLQELFQAYKTLSCAEERPRYDEMLDVMARAFSMQHGIDYLRAAMSHSRIGHTVPDVHSEEEVRRKLNLAPAPEELQSPHRQTYLELENAQHCKARGLLASIFRRRR